MDFGGGKVRLKRLFSSRSAARHQHKLRRSSDAVDAFHEHRDVPETLLRPMVAMNAILKMVWTVEV